VDPETLLIMGVGRMQIQQIIKRKSEVLDNYESNVSNDRKREVLISSNLTVLIFYTPVVNLPVTPVLDILIKLIQGWIQRLLMGAGGSDMEQ
jgi:hypothetical protein